MSQLEKKIIINEREVQNIKEKMQKTTDWKMYNFYLSHIEIWTILGLIQQYEIMLNDKQFLEGYEAGYRDAKTDIMKKLGGLKPHVRDNEKERAAGVPGI